MATRVYSSDELDALARRALTLEVVLGDDVCELLADLTLRIHKVQAEKNRAVLTPAQLRDYRERSESERAGMRVACEHVLKAAVLLDLFQNPG